MTVENRSSSRFNHEFKNRPELTNPQSAKRRKSCPETVFLEVDIALDYVSRHIFRYFVIDEYLLPPSRLKQWIGIGTSSAVGQGYDSGNLSTDKRNRIS